MVCLGLRACLNMSMTPSANKSTAALLVLLVGVRKAPSPATLPLLQAHQPTNHKHLVQALAAQLLL